MEETRAEVEADIAKAEAVSANEAVQTTRAIAEAERRKSLAFVNAESEANATARRSEIAAASERLAAKDLAEARRELAAADNAVKLADVEIHLAQIEANNSKSESVIAMEIEKTRLASLPQIVREMVKPAEKIKAININHLTGGSSSGSGTGSKPPVNQAVDSIMDMAIQLPVLQKIGESVGVNFEKGLSGIVDQGDNKKDPD